MAAPCTRQLLASACGKLSRFCSPSGPCGGPRRAGLSCGGTRTRTTTAGTTTTDTSSSLLSTSLSQTPPSLPKPIYSSSGNDQTQDTKVTTLSNGFRVASQNKFGHYCTVGVAVDSGSRYEISYPSGISHYLEKLAFMSTRKFKSKEEIMSMLEKFGGICDCQGSRDTLIYAVSAETKGLEEVVDMLCETIWQPKIQLHEVEIARQSIAFELEDLELSANQEVTMNEMIHSAAYVDNTLGLPKVCPRDNILDKVIDRKVLYTYLKNYMRPDKMVLAGVGCDHDRLVQLAEKHFSSAAAPAVWDSDRDLQPLGSKKVWTKDFSGRMFNKELSDRSASQYTGGYNKVTKDMSHLCQGPNPLPELGHFAIGLQSCSHQDDNFVTYCVLNMLMGGGGSFSAGGPGKGMYTRLYTNVLNRHHWIFNATAYNQAYSDSGLFYIYGSCEPDKISELAEVLVQEARSMTGNIDKVELSRAKKQLQSMLLMNLESRPVIFEDVARQVLSSAKRKPPSFFLDKISAIRSEDIQAAAEKMLKSKMAVAALGKVDSLPSYHELESQLVSGGGGRQGAGQRIFSFLR